MVEQLQPVLLRRAYQFREDMVNQKSPDCFLPFSKPIGELGYAYVVVRYDYGLSHSSEYEPNTFSVLVFRRHDRDTPVPQQPGPFRTDITGYLPGLSDPPLPLVFSMSTTKETGKWNVTSEDALFTQALVIGQRLLRPVLPWLECHESSQFVSVGKSWYIQPLANYLNHQWDAEQAFAAMSVFDPPGFSIEAGDDTELVYEVLTAFHRLRIPRYAQSVRRDMLEYLYACLQNAIQFDEAVYTLLAYGKS